MHDIMNLKEMLLDELSEYGRKGELHAKTLETIDTLAHATKNLCKIIEDAEMMEESSMIRPFAPSSVKEQFSMVKRRTPLVRMAEWGSLPARLSLFACPER